MSVSTNITKLRWLAAIRWSFVTMPIIVLFFQKYGLSYTEIFLIQAVYAVAVVVLQIPAGYFADTIGRKRVLILGCFFLVISTGLYAFWHNVWSFILGEIFMALSLSLCMGADSALLYESLEQLQQSDTYLKQEGMIMLYGRVSEAVGGVLGAIIAYVSLESCFVFQFLIALCALPIAYSLVETTAKETYTRNIKNFSLSKALSDLKATHTILFKTKRVVGLILWYSAIIGFGTLSCVWFLQPIFNDIGLPIYLFGLAWAVLNLSAAFAGKYADWLNQRVGSINIIIALPIVLALAIFLLAHTQAMLAILLLAMIVQGVRGLKVPIILTLINREVSDSIRATVLSYEEMYTRLLFAICAPMVGLLATHQSLAQAMNYLAVVVILFGVFFSWRICAARQRSMLK